MIQAVVAAARAVGHFLKAAVGLVRLSMEWLASPQGQLAAETVVVAFMVFDELFNRLVSTFIDFSSKEARKWAA